MVGLGVELAAAFEDAAQIVHGFGVGGHGAGVALGDHAAHVFFGLGLHPHSGAVREQFVERGRVGDDAARRGDDHVGIDLHGFFERAAFVATVAAHSVQVVDFAHAAPGQRFDLVVQFDEGHAHVVGQHFGECRFARTTQADERDARVAMQIAGGRGAEDFSGGEAHAAQLVLVAAFEQFADQQPFGAGSRHVAQQLGHGAMQRLRDLVQHQDGDIAGAVFEIGEMPLGDFGGDGQAAPRDAALRPQLAHAFAQGLQHLILVGRVGVSVRSLVPGWTLGVHLLHKTS